MTAWLASGELKRLVRGMHRTATANQMRRRDSDLFVNAHPVSA